MLRRVIVIGVIVFAALMLMKSGWALRRSGLIGSCTAIAAMPDGGEQAQCRAGVLDGLPDLSGKGCKLVVIGRSVEVWSCPAPIGSVHGGV